MTNATVLADRIKLAEAMGWKQKLQGNLFWYAPNGTPRGINLPFDPFTDANDDYAVLEWMRESHLWSKFKQELYSLRDNNKVSHKWMIGRYTWSYQIGDYARAALKVIDDD